MLVLGFDGGGSTARLALADQSGAIVHYSQSGGVNPLDNAGWHATMNSILTLPAALGTRLTRAVVGLPSFGEVASADRQMAAVVTRHFGTRAQLINDVELAHYAAFAGEPGILILSGTGSMAIGGGGPLPLVRVGGWGDELGDEGSGFWIGHRALVTAGWMIDGRTPPTTFLDRLLTHLEIADRDDPFALTNWYYAQPHRRSATAALFRFVDALADEGDATALSIRAEAADHLVLHLRAVERQAGQGALPWSYAGGTFGSQSLLAAVIERFGRSPTPPRHQALAGSLLLAARKAGWPADALWQSQVATALANSSHTISAIDGAHDDQHH